MGGFRSALLCSVLAVTAAFAQTPGNVTGRRFTYSTVASDPSCAAGSYFTYANSTATEIYACVNGTKKAWGSGSGGAGDVESAGDCTSGACLDGTSDGGTWIKFYDADGAGQLITGDLAAARVWTLPDATGTVALTTSNVATATALAADPADCSANQFATTIAASGALSCAAITDADVPNTITINTAATATTLSAGTHSGAYTFSSASNSLTAASVTAVSTSQKKLNSNVYNCDYDWDGDADIDCADVKMCLDDVATDAEVSNDGADHGLTVLFGDRTYSCGSTSGMCPYALPNAGIMYQGVPPRENHVTIDADSDACPGLYMVADGGTWFTCGDYSKKLFTIQRAVGGGMKDIGAYGVNTFLEAGGDRINGWSKSVFENIKVYGDDGTYASDIYGMVLYNSQFNFGRSLTFFHIDQGLHLAAKTCDWQPGNSVWEDVLTVTRNRSTSAAGILLDTTAPSSVTGCTEAAQAASLNYITMIRPHVQVIYADPPAGSSAIKLDGVTSAGQIYAATILGADIETGGSGGVNGSDYGIYLKDAASSNYINIAGCTGSAAVSDIYLADVGLINNTIVNQCTTAKFYAASSNNVVLGVINELSSGSATPQGLYQIYDNSNFYTEGGRGTFSPTFSAQTGAVPIYGSRVNAVFGSADGSNYVPFSGVYSTPSVNVSNSAAYRASLYGVNSAPILAGTAASYANGIANFVGVTSDPQITATGGAGTPHTITSWTGFRAKLTDGGTNWTASAARAFEVDTTGIGASLPTGGTITTYEGLRVGDQYALGTQNNTIAIASQTAGVNTGNFRFIGGDYNTGHMAFAAFNDAGRAHVWFDGTNDRLAYHIGDPAATDDADFALSEAGIRFEGATNDGIEMILTTADPTSADKTITLPNATGNVVISTASSTSGPAAWAANTVSCTTACSNIGLANCAGNIDLTDHATGDCADTTNARLCQCY